MAPRLLRVGIATHDLEAALAAWRNASGLEPAQAAAGERESRLAVGDVGLALTALADGGREGLKELTLEVEDIEASLARLVANGARIKREATGVDGRRALELDQGSTFGVPIVLVQRRPSAPPP